MSYIGDFPPCTHRFVNSNGVILCQFCGLVTGANTPVRISTHT